jgi:hypothetical protein
MGLGLLRYSEAVICFASQANSGSRPFLPQWLIPKKHLKLGLRVYSLETPTDISSKL